MSKTDVKSHLLDHSEIKVRLYGEYLKRYLNIISRDGYTKRIKLFDLFCGPGIYENGGEGSPVVASRIIKDVYYKNLAQHISQTKIDCLFNDLDQDRIAILKRTISEKKLHYSDFGKLSFSNFDYSEILKKLLNSLPSYKSKEQKAFIFIDPYEYKHIKAGQIKSLMDASSGSAEVLLWLPTQFMYRFSKNGTPEALKDFITELYPDQSELDYKNVWEFIRQLKIGFQHFMGPDYFVDTFTIEKEPSTVFCLFFFTSHIKGFEKMLEAKWEIDNEAGRGWKYDGQSQSLFHELRTNPLEEALKSFMHKNVTTNSSIYEFTLRQGFLAKHTVEIFKNWQAKGLLEVMTKAGQKARKGSFYLNYTDYKGEKDKVNFKLH